MTNLNQKLVKVLIDSKQYWLNKESLLTNLHLGEFAAKSCEGIFQLI